MLTGLPTCNVELKDTLNALPPSLHLTGIPKQTNSALESSSRIDELLTLGDYVLTGNKENASVNIFTTQLGLTRTLQHNFFKQKYQTLENASPLPQTKFKFVLGTPLVKVFSKRGQAVPLFNESNLEQEQ